KDEPTKASKPGSVGFEGAPSGDLPKIPPGERSPVDSEKRIGHAVDPGSVGFEGSPSGGFAKIPAGKGGPDSIFGSVDSSSAPEGVMSWAQWKAAALNRLFKEQGLLGQPGHITAETVSHGEQMTQTASSRRRART